MARITTIVTRARHLRVAAVILTAVAAASLAAGHGSFWAGDLSSLSPVPPALQRVDQSLRHDMGASDATTLIVIHKPDLQAALRAAERLTASLVQSLALVGLDSPSRYLPSLQTQQARQAALPDASTLRTNLDQALDSLPFQQGLFEPFIAAVAAQRSAPPISRADLDGTSLSLKLDTLLLHQSNGWAATISLPGPPATSSGGSPATAIAQAIAAEPDALLVNLKTESGRLLRVYLQEGITLASLGAGMIGGLLLVTLRSWRRLAMIAAPLACAVVTTFALLRLGGQALSIFNLFGMLLVVAIGSNYCLFFDRQRADPAATPRVLASLLLANACTVMGFGVLAFSQTPVLHDLGKPVAIGTFLSLMFATIIMAPSQSLDPAMH